MIFIFQGLNGSGCGRTMTGRTLNVGDTFSGDEINPDVLKIWLERGIAVKGKPVDQAAPVVQETPVQAVEVKEVVTDPVVPKSKSKKVKNGQ